MSSPAQLNIESSYSYQFFRQYPTINALLFQCYSEEPVTEALRAKTEEETIFNVWIAAATPFRPNPSYHTVDPPMTIGSLRRGLEKHFPTYGWQPYKYNHVENTTLMTIATAKTVGYTTETWFVRITEHITYPSGKSITKELLPKAPFMSNR